MTIFLLYLLFGTYLSHRFMPRAGVVGLYVGALAWPGIGLVMLFEIVMGWDDHKDI